MCVSVTHTHTHMCMSLPFTYKQAEQKAHYPVESQNQREQFKHSTKDEMDSSIYDLL